MATGYVVIESCEDYAQVLGLKTGDGLPPGGVLDWAVDGCRRHVFALRHQAREAIERTHHYSRAFGIEDLPEKQYCKVHPINLPD